MSFLTSRGWKFCHIIISWLSFYSLKSHVFRGPSDRWRFLNISNCTRLEKFWTGPWKKWIKWKVNHFFKKNDGESILGTTTILRRDNIAWDLLKNKSSLTWLWPGCIEWLGWGLKECLKANFPPWSFSLIPLLWLSSHYFSHLSTFIICLYFYMTNISISLHCPFAFWLVYNSLMTLNRFIVCKNEN